jgi:hypothetical protein
MKLIMKRKAKRLSKARLGPVALVTVALLGAPTSALAWSNGVDGPNTFGTHDWILRKAINASGRKARWVHVRVALRATDDPDTKDGIDHASDRKWHIYDRWGHSWGDADEAAAVWFRRTKRRLGNGRKRSASTALGYLAHIIGDVAQPMHTDKSGREERVHGPYEGAVDRRFFAKGKTKPPFRYDGRDAARPRARTRMVARQAHDFYRELVRAFDRYGYTRKVHRITKRQLKRAANAMADLITSLR